MHTTYHILAYCPQFFNYEFLFFVQYAEGGTKGHKNPPRKSFLPGRIFMSLRPSFGILNEKTGIRSCKTEDNMLKYGK